MSALTDYVTRDGNLHAGPFTPNDAFAALLRMQGNSVDHATRYEGWHIGPGRFAVIVDTGRPVVVDTFKADRNGIGVGFSLEEAAELARSLEELNRAEPLKPYDGWNPYRNGGAGEYDPTWTPDGMRRMAWQETARHDHPGDMSQLARENCAACVLAGYLPRKRADIDPETLEGFKTGPNYAGWHRVYVEAGRPIPRRAGHRRVEWVAGFLEAIGPDYDNQAYRRALARCVVTFGVAAHRPEVTG